ncbi:MAG: hypothetical protein H7X80_07420 [bacterium]|nr:hypothetical protein [Candidatus Kapabacteria bacterium]
MKVKALLFASLCAISLSLTACGSDAEETPVMDTTAVEAVPSTPAVDTVAPAAPVDTTAPATDTAAVTDTAAH